MNSVGAIFLAVATLALGACASGATNEVASDGALADSAVVDAAASDGPLGDAAADGPAVDADQPDGAEDASAATTSAQIAAARAASGSGLSLAITAATVTYRKPSVAGASTSNDPPGFTIQAERAGPALFVEVDPLSLSPVPRVGDLVSFSITAMGRTGNTTIVAAKAISGWAVTGEALSLEALVQDLGAATDLVTALDGYESELVDVAGTVTGAFEGSGASFERAQIETSAVAGDPNLLLRIPGAVRDSIDLVPQCAFALEQVPVHRYMDAVQLPAYVAGDITLSGCPAPVVESAVAVSATSVRITFSRRVREASITSVATQFTFGDGLTATAAVVDGRAVTLTTSAQTSGASYTVSVVGVTDLQNAALGAPASATFSGFSLPTVVRINEVSATIANNCDQIELRAVSPGSMAGFALWGRTATGFESLLTFASTFSVATNDVIVVHLAGNTAACNPDSRTQEVGSVTEQASAQSYTTAFDWYSNKGGLNAGTNVIAIFDGVGQLVDAVYLHDGTANFPSATQAGVAATTGGWGPVGATYTTGAQFAAAAVGGLNTTGSLRTDMSIQRRNDCDTNLLDDWTIAAHRWGQLNSGQSTPPACSARGRR